MMSQVVLQLRNVSKKYGSKYVLSDVNMTIHKGDIYGLIGRNGAGKTTLTRIITSLAAADGGEVELFGETTATGLQLARRRMAAIIESPALYPNLTAEQNLVYYQKLKGITDKGMINKILEMVGLTDTGKMKFKNFSLGMKQRLGIALALLNSPDFIILDEPINGLDPMGIIEMREIIKKLNEEHRITILISSHILTELSMVATRYGFIEKGKVLKELTHEALNETCQKSLVLKVDDISRAVTVLEIKMQLTNYKVVGKDEIHLRGVVDQISEINAVLVGSGIGVLSVSEVGENLEDYFRNLIKEGA